MADGEAAEDSRRGPCGRRRRRRRRPSGGGDRRCRPGASGPSRGRPGSARRHRRAASSRGSVTSRAMTAWRPATSVRAGTQSRGPRKSETMTTTPGVVRMAPTSARARAGEVSPPPSSGGSVAIARRRPSIPRLPPFGGVTASRPAPNVTTPSRLPRRAAKRPTTSAAPSATSALRRSAVPKCIDGEWSSRSQAVSCRSGTSSRTCGTSVRAVAFQSIRRTSSPGSYGRMRSSSRPCAVPDDRDGRRSSGRRRGGRGSARAGGRGGRRWGRGPVAPRSGLARRCGRGPRSGAGRRSAPCGRIGWPTRGVGHAVGSIAISRRGAGTSETTRSMMVSAVIPSARAA